VEKHPVDIDRQKGFIKNLFLLSQVGDHEEQTKTFLSGLYHFILYNLEF